MDHEETEREAAGHSEYREPWIHFVGLATEIIVPLYLIWRGLFTLDGTTTLLALPLLLGETHGYLTYLGFLVMTWEATPPETPEPRPGLTVDFLIPTYNEEFAVLAPTVAGAVAVRYPHKTYVLDDGRRSWVRKLCKELGATYISRKDNAGAKAGNLNHALARTTGEFVAVVDADFVPAPGFLDDTLGFFDDPEVAFVQGPQEFFNGGSFQHLPGDEDGWHEQRIFFRTIQTGKNRWNAAFWCGSPSVLRRSALEDVGGVISETVTEDLHTSLKLHSNGWKSVYQPKVIARGIAPNSYDGFILQRLRWAQGTMEVIRKEWPGWKLTLAQKVNYLASTGTYFDAMRKFAFLTILPLVLFTDGLPVNTSAATFLGFWGVQFFLGLYAMHLLGRRDNRYLMTEFFDLMKMFAFLQASLTLLSGKRVAFRVTPKGSSDAELKVRNVLPFLLLAGIYCLAISVGIARLGGFGLSTAHPLVQFVAVLWSAAILSFLVVVVVYGIRKDSRRQADRVDVTLPGSYLRTKDAVKHPVTLQNLTTAGCAFRTSVPPRIGESLTVAVDQGNCVFRAKVRSVRELDGDGTTGPYRAWHGRYLVGASIRTNAHVRSHLASLIAQGIFAGAEDGARGEHETVAQPKEAAA